MQTTLDSPPGPPPRPLKRSASVASLPTPPRTHHKRKRGGSKHSRASDEDLSATDEDNVEKLIKEAEDEESFWLATNAASSSTTVKNTSPPLLYRRLQAQSQTQTQAIGVPPVSPPPSHRKPPRAAVVPRTPTPKSSTVSPPATPTRPLISRDSPNNPFLASPLGSQDEVFINESDSALSSQQEKPTMAFVFRGVRRSFPNPYYNASGSGPNPKSQLPPEHPDFEPDERGKKKSDSKNRRVAEGAGRGRQGRRAPAASNASRATPGKSDDEGEGEAAPMKPLKLNLAA
ncbi:hypothetical protein MSAN_00349000 [Mycena sanguinolenta]|uniref:Uncharacterized protein n=1 Tax=Mycena sanguinolenta TaxID=230812 RepID=A0A8H6ZD04_9AGAR|nr:hypothetical protein MSAN_00349000 [Mycena sanguinolenta]